MATGSCASWGLIDLRCRSAANLEDQLRKMQAGNDAFSLLSGLATVAAVTRSNELPMKSAFSLASFDAARPGVDIEPEDALRIAMIAAASQSDKASWCKFVGEWLTELAYEDMTHEKAANLYLCLS